MRGTSHIDLPHKPGQPKHLRGPDDLFRYFIRLSHKQSAVWTHSGLESIQGVPGPSSFSSDFIHRISVVRKIVFQNVLPYIFYKQVNLNPNLHLRKIVTMLDVLFFVKLNQWFELIWRPSDNAKYDRQSQPTCPGYR